MLVMPATNASSLLWGHGRSRQNWTDSRLGPTARMLAYVRKSSTRADAGRAVAVRRLSRSSTIASGVEALDVEFVGELLRT